MKGLREAHAHIGAHGEALTLPNLAGCRGVRECLEVVRSARAGASSERPVFIRIIGARIEAWEEQRWPTLEELDSAAGGAPCVVMSFDFHCAAASSAAMAAAGLRAGEAVPPNGVVCVDGRGEATGLLLEQAAYRAWAGAPEPTMRERGAHVLAALEDLQRLGFSEVHDLHSQDWLGPMLSGLAREGRLPVDRVWLYPPVERLRASVEAAGGWESERVVLAGGKVFADGTLNSRTALMLHDYRSALPGMERGKAMLSAPALEDAMRLTQSLGVGLAVHAIGDGAVRMVLDAWERARPRGGPGWLRRSGAGIPCLRIEHCEVIDRADIGRFAPMGVVCSVQPCHLLADIEALRRYLPHRLDRVLPLRELIDAGCVPGGGPGDGGALWFGSDVPIVRADPRDSVLAATKRRREGMGEEEAIGMGQGITVQEAWAGFGPVLRG